MNNVSSNKKDIYVVLGMARSGTSAITRGLKALGIDLGNHFGVGNNKWNPKGFWEDKEIVYKINRGVSYALHDTWMSVHLIDEQCRNNPVLDDLKHSAVDLLTQRMEGIQYWGFKDPRTCRILPFWQDVFKTLDVNEHYIIALRNPLASAASWQKLSGTDIEIGLLLWLIHLIPAIEGTRGKQCVVVSYDLMLQEPHKQIARIKNALNIPALTDASEVDAYANGFLDKKLQHHDFTDEDLKHHPAVAIAPLCTSMYELLLKLAKDEMAFDSEAFTSAWQKVKEEFDQIYPVYSYINMLLKRNKQLERQLRTIHRSVPWKLTFPLRIIDDVLRFMRRTMREKRKLLRSYE